MQETLDITRNDAAGQYEISSDGQVVGRAKFLEKDGTVVFPSVVVSPEVRGRGIAEKLTKYALDDAIAAGNRIAPVCPYVVTYVRRHPEYQEHLDERSHTSGDGEACQI